MIKKIPTPIGKGMICSALLLLIQLSHAATHNTIRPGREDTTIIEDTITIDGSITNNGSGKNLVVTATGQGVYDDEVGGYVSISSWISPTAKDHNIYAGGTGSSVTINAQHPESWIKLTSSTVPGYRAILAHTGGTITVNGNIFSPNNGICANPGGTIVVNGDVKVGGSITYSGVTVNGNIDIRNGGLHDVVYIKSDRITINRGTTFTTHRYQSAICNGGKQISRYKAVFNVIGDVCTDCGLIEMTMLGNSTLTGKTILQENVLNYNTPAINFVMKDSSQWTVTGDSHMTSLIMEAATSLVFSFDENDGDFTNINALSVSLAAGSILRLDQDAAYFSEGETVNLFNATDSYTDSGVLIVSRDGYILDIDASLSGNGTYHLTGQVIGLIPEPASSALMLLGMSSLLFKRRRPL